MNENHKKQEASSVDPLPPLHTSLLQLVQKNKFIPHFLNKLTTDDPNLCCLKKAITKGNFRSQIWNHRNCNLYLIYLIQNQRRLAQQAAIDPDVLFTQRPPLKNGDSMAWMKLLKSDRLSAAIWFNLTGDADRAEELLQMIEQGLNLFHPDLPMTATKRLALLDYFENQPANATKISNDQANNVNIVSQFQSQFFSVIDHETGELSDVAANDDGEALKYNS